MLMLCIFLLIVFFTGYIIYKFIRAKRIPHDTVLAFTGGLGTGKTLIAVNSALRTYKKTLLLWRLGFYNKDIKSKFLFFKRKYFVPMPLLYSNIPIRIRRPFFISNKRIVHKYFFSSVLTYEHIILDERIIEYSVILIDELGQIADQYKYDNPFVMQSIQNFIRFYRHFVDGRLFVTDQSSSNIVVAIRRRLNVIYNLHEFRRFFIFFYIVKVSTIFIAEDMLSFADVKSDTDFDYFIGFLPFKFFKFLDIFRLFTYKKYESRVYKPLYKDVVLYDNVTTFEDYFTDYLIDIPNSEDMKKVFKRQGYLTKLQMKKYIEDYKNDM